MDSLRRAVSGTSQPSAPKTNKDQTNKNEQEIIKLQNDLEKVNALLSANMNTFDELNKVCMELNKTRIDAIQKQNQYAKDNSIDRRIDIITNENERREIIGNKQKEYDEYIRLKNDAELMKKNSKKYFDDLRSVSAENNALNKKRKELIDKINNLK